MVFAGFALRGLAVCDPLSLEQLCQLLVLIPAGIGRPRLGRERHCLYRVYYTAQQRFWQIPDVSLNEESRPVWAETVRDAGVTLAKPASDLREALF